MAPTGEFQPMRVAFIYKLRVGNVSISSTRQCTFNYGVEADVLLIGKSMKHQLKDSETLPHTEYDRITSSSPKGLPNS